MSLTGRLDFTILQLQRARLVIVRDRQAYGVLSLLEVCMMSGDRSLLKGRVGQRIAPLELHSSIFLT